MVDLTHFNRRGEAHIVDVGDKDVTRRRAVAAGEIEVTPEIIEGIRSGGHKKGDVIGVARIAGIMAAKRTSELVPLCHPLFLTHVSLTFELGDEPPRVMCRTQVETDGQTGVEIEALTATQVALLTVYDMCKSLHKGMVIRNVRLLEKSGGRSGNWRAPS